LERKWGALGLSNDSCYPGLGSQPECLVSELWFEPITCCLQTEPSPSR